MSSSNWRLIRSPLEGAEESGGGAAVSAAEPEAATEAAAAASQGRTVFRGRNKAGAHQSHDAAQAIAGLAQGSITGSVDAAALAAEIAQMKREAQEHGYEIGRTRAETELRAAVEGASALVDRLEMIAPERASEVAHAIAELALAVAKRIVGHEVRVEPSLLCGALEAAVSTINGSPEAHVLLNPSAVDQVRSAWEALHGRAYLGKRWVFEGDPTLPVGGCTVRYEHGFVEAGLEAQLEEIGIALDRAIPNLARATVEEDVA
jgi:flagellar assembly protein FliH